MKRKQTVHNPLICKQRIAFISVAVFFLILLIGFVFSFINRNVVGYVNGFPVYSEELTMYAQDCRAEVSSEFSKEHNLSGTGIDFWTTSYDGVLPLDSLIRASMKDLVRDKIIQQECVKRGIIAPLDFLQLKSSFQDENESRKETLENGGFVYGTQQYTLRQYSDYQMTLSEDELKSSLLSGSSSPSEQQLQQAFDSLDESFKRKDFTAKGYAFVWSTGSLETGQRTIQQALSQNIAPDELPDALSDTLPDLTVIPIDIDTAQRSKEDNFADTLTYDLFDMNCGDYKATVANGLNTLYYLTEKDGGGYYTLQEAPGLAESKYVNDTFEQMIESQIEQCTVELNKPKAQKCVLKSLR